MSHRFVIDSAQDQPHGGGHGPRGNPQLTNRSVAWPEAALRQHRPRGRLCAAAAALRRDVRGLGIDAEETTCVHERLWRQIASDTDIAWFREAGSDDSGLVRTALLFSANEAFYKAQFCVSQAWVGFHDAHARFTDDGRSRSSCWSTWRSRSRRARALPGATRCATRTWGGPGPRP